MPDHLDRAFFGDLKETRRCAERLGVHVQRFVYRGGALRGELGGAFGQAAEIAHLLLAEQEVKIGPAFGALRRANLDETPARFEHTETPSMTSRHMPLPRIQERSNRERFTQCRQSTCRTLGNVGR